MRFKNRREAGRWLGEELARYKDLADALVLGLPRGGVPVAGDKVKAATAKASGGTGQVLKDVSPEAGAEAIFMPRSDPCV